MAMLGLLVLLVEEKVVLKEELVEVAGRGSASLDLAEGCVGVLGCQVRVADDVEREAIILHAEDE